MPKSLAVTRFTPGEAVYVLDRLIRERRVKAGEVAQLVGEMHREIAELERRLAALRQAAGPVRPSRDSEPTSRARSSVTGSNRRRRLITPELAKSRQLQGEYMGLIRHIQGPARARMKKLASDQGREAAIKAMRGLLAK